MDDSEIVELSGSSFNEEEDLEPQMYNDFVGSELEAIKSREKDAGFRHHVKETPPSLYFRFKAALWRFSTDERSSIPVCISSSLSGGFICEKKK